MNGSIGLVVEPLSFNVVIGGIDARDQCENSMEFFLLFGYQQHALLHIAVQQGLGGSVVFPLVWVTGLTHICSCAGIHGLNLRHILRSCFSNVHNHFLASNCVISI